MVKKNWTLVVCFFLWLSASIFAEPAISVEIQGDVATEGSRIVGIITVTYQKNDGTPDPNSFELDGERLEVRSLGTSTSFRSTEINGRRESKTTLASNYRFELPGRNAGLYVLAPISVRVGNRRAASVSISFEVLSPSVNPDFRLQASVEGTLPLYPGQRIRFTYLLFYRDAVDVSAQELPLLEAKGFKAIGTKTERQVRQGQSNVLEWAQEVEAAEPGIYYFGPSYIEGFAYQTDFFGRRRYRRPAIRAQADTVSVEVLPLPEEEKPPAFDGAVGVFNWKLRIIGDSTLAVGDKLQLEIEVTGHDGLHSIQFGRLSEQKGLKGNFRMSSLPARISDGELSKTFIYELRPLSSEVTEIPSLQLSFFNTQSKQYETLVSDPIPLKVKNLLIPVLAESRIVVPSPKKEDLPQVEAEAVETNALQKIEIFGNYILRDDDLVLPWYATLKILWIAPFSLLCGALQYVALLFLRRRKKGEILEAEGLFLQAAKVNDSARYFLSLEKAFLQRLLESGLIDASIHSYRDLSGEGQVGEVRRFLGEIEEQRFSFDQTGSMEQVRADAETLFYKIY